MKFTCSVCINKPVNTVIEEFLNPESLKRSMKGFIKKELISGELHATGAKSKLYYDKFEMEETILENNLPMFFYAQYDHTHMSNTMKTTFKPLSDNETQIITEIHYTIFKGFVIKIISKLFPNFFKKQTQKWLNEFKKYTEK
ncbi:hypothetical protein [Pseudofulvibacter geojedonensis]|uniref:SRPBCC family protein n=1 Tax=Pseudofulvibacter geojedonensis TaxID=1123758 RepID=A0ABW3HY60_9FLAO